MIREFCKTSKLRGGPHLIAIVGALILIGVAGPAQGQTIDTNTINTILQGLQGGTTPTDTTTTTTTTTTDDGVGTTPLTGRQSTISNQFTAATGGSIGARRPGLWVQQGIAEHEGTLDIPGDVPEEQPSFFKSTFDTMAQNVIDLFSGILDGVNGLITSLRSAGTGGGGSTTTTFVPPPQNATTTWSSTPQTIP